MKNICIVKECAKLTDVDVSTPDKSSGKSNQVRKPSSSVYTLLNTRTVIQINREQRARYG